MLSIIFYRLYTAKSKKFYLAAYNWGKNRFFASLNKKHHHADWTQQGKR